MSGTWAPRAGEQSVMVARRARGFAEALGALLRRHGRPVATAALDDVDAAGAAATPEVAVLVDVDDAGDDAVARLRRRVSRLLALVDGPGPDRDDVDGWVTSRQLAAAPAPEALQAAVSRSAAGAEVVHPALDRLTSREREVLAELAAGRSYHELSGALGISLHTVRTHVRNLLGKLDLTTRLEAVTLARRAGLVAAREAGE